MVRSLATTLNRKGINYVVEHLLLCGLSAPATTVRAICERLTALLLECVLARPGPRCLYIAVDNLHLWLPIGAALFVWTLLIHSGDTSSYGKDQNPAFLVLPRTVCRVAS